MALLNNPEVVRQVEAHYQAILDICKANKYNYGGECDVCGSTQRVLQIDEFANGPYLCLRHRCSWRGVWVRHGYGDPKLYFAKWLADQLVPEAKKHAAQ